MSQAGWALTGVAQADGLAQTFCIAQLGSVHDDPERGGGMRKGARGTLRK